MLPQAAELGQPTHSEFLGDIERGNDNLESILRKTTLTQEWSQGFDIHCRKVRRNFALRLHVWWIVFKNYLEYQLPKIHERATEYAHRIQKGMTWNFTTDAWRTTDPEIEQIWNKKPTHRPRCLNMMIIKILNCVASLGSMVYVQLIDTYLKDHVDRFYTQWPDPAPCWSAYDLSSWNHHCHQTLALQLTDVLAKKWTWALCFLHGSLFLRQVPCLWRRNKHGFHGKILSSSDNSSLYICLGDWYHLGHWDLRDPFQA